MKEVIIAINASVNTKWRTEDLHKEINEFVKINREKEIQVSLYLFNQTVTPLCEHTKVSDLTIDKKDISTFGELDFYGSIGTILERVSDRVNHLTKNKKPDKTFFCIITENYKDLPGNYSKEEIGTFITYQVEDYEWDFLFFGIDVKRDAKKIGIKSDNIYSVDCSSDGFKKVFDVISKKL